MTAARSGLHPQLVADCHVLGRFDVCALLLHRNASVPWLILVPGTTRTDFLSLPRAFRAAVLEECARSAEFLRRDRGAARINFASLGNVVPQLHLHVIGRSPGDSCWPTPVWGHLEASRNYDAAEIERFRDTLARGYGLRPDDATG